jgi:hypothetical protein
MNVRGAAASAFVAFALAAPVGWASAASSAERIVAAGESIYRSGVLGSGASLEATREAGGPAIRGAEAACVNCHQRSGFGVAHQESSPVAAAGPGAIPPIAGPYLFGTHKGHKEKDLPYVDGMRADREPYTDSTLARAIREGIDSEGQPLSYLMPRFALGDADMAALIAYLKTLDPARVPGVTDTVLHFATIVTPDADPAKRRGMLEVLEKYFAERNSRQMVPSARLQASGRTQYSRTMFMVHRQWQLHVWELTGPPATWQAQLSERLDKEPVLAVVSGVGGSDWAPVHEFCERRGLPCLFPNVEVPVESQDDFYDLYLSRGVLLEADLIAAKIHDSARTPAPVVHQIYRVGDSGGPAARKLAADLERRGLTVHDHVLRPDGGGLSEAVRAAAGADALVLWLRAPDLASLADPPQGAVFISGLMGGLERAPLPASWRQRTDMAYPFDLPQKRVVRVDYPLAWFRIRNIPVVDEQVQADTYLACGLLSEVLSHMVDTFVRPYLIERLQSMVEHRVVTGYYPRLTLAENQHFASKGGYLVRFAASEGTGLVADSDWLAP